MARDRFAWHTLNAVRGSGFGFFAYEETGSIFAFNTATRNELGIAFEGESSGNIVRGNTANGNFRSGIGLWGYLDGDELVQPIPYDNRLSFNIAQGNGVVDLGEFAWDEEDVPTIPPGMPCQNTWRWNHYVTQVSPPDCIGPSCSVSVDDLNDFEDDKSDAQ